MRVGRLKTLAKLLSRSGAELVPELFISITEPDAFINFGQGLLSSERTVIRARWQAGDLIQAGTWLKTSTGRLFLIVGFSEPKTRQDLVLGAREAIGYQATVTAGTDGQGQPIVKACTVALMEYLVKPNEGNQLMPAEHRRRAQFATAEHQPQVGQTFSLGDDGYRITELDAANSNEQVTTAWVVKL